MRFVRLPVLFRAQRKQIVAIDIQHFYLLRAGQLAVLLHNTNEAFALPAHEAAPVYYHHPIVGAVQRGGFCCQWYQMPDVFIQRHNAVEWSLLFGREHSHVAIFSKISEIRQSGFIAQEVEQAAISSGFNFNGVSSPKSESDFYKLSYDLFVVPIIKAIQEQQVLIRNQKQKTEVLISKIDKQNKAIEQLKNEGIGFESTALSKDIKLSIINSESQKIIVQYTIPVEFINPSLMVCNSAGEKIKSYALAVNESSSKLELSELTSGSHYFCILSGGQVLAFQRINVK